jgi:hypothetical protein
MSSIESKFGEYFADLKVKSNSDEVFDKIIEAMEDYYTLYQSILKKNDETNVEFSVQQFFTDSQIIYSSIGEYFTISLDEDDSDDEDLDDHGRELMRKVGDTIKSCERIVDYFGTLKKTLKDQTPESFEPNVKEIDPVILNDFEIVSNMFKEMSDTLQESNETIEKSLKSTEESSKGLLYTLEKTDKFNEIKEKIKEIDEFCEEDFEEGNDDHKEKIAQYVLDLHTFMKQILSYWSRDNSSNDSRETNLISSEYTYKEWEVIEKVKSNDYSREDSKEISKHLSNVNLKDIYKAITRKLTSLVSFLQKN